jgi:hypothetical protein
MLKLRKVFKGMMMVDECCMILVRWNQILLVETDSLSEFLFLESTKRQPTCAEILGRMMGPWAERNRSIRPRYFCDDRDDRFTVSVQAAFLLVSLQAAVGIGAKVVTLHLGAEKIQ